MNNYDTSSNDINFIPFKDNLSLENPLLINDNSNKNIYTFPSSEKDNNELFSYNMTSRKTPSELVNDLEIDFDDELILENNIASIDKIYSEIKSKSPGTITLMEAYNIPSSIAKLIGRRFIKLTLDYERRGRL